MISNYQSNVSKWNGTIYLCSLLGAFISDSYCGCYLTCALSQVIFVLGLVLLSISSSIFLIKPSGCRDGKVECEPTSRIGVVIFCVSIYLIALGFGGHQPTIATIARCLDKAATIVEDNGNRQERNPWRLCTITQVEEAKCVLKMLPIRLCTIIYSVILIQVTSLFVQQGDVMYREIGNIDFPAATMYAFGVLSVLVCTIIYRQVVVPIARKLSGNPKGLSELQKMGIGLVIGMLSMIAAGVTEIQRRKLVAKGQKISSLSIFWQIPQQVLAGASEVFMYVGQLEFFIEQASDGMKSIGSSLCMASFSLGSYGNSLMVIIVMKITARGKSPGWIPKNLNEGHLERFYFLIAGLTVFDCFIFYFCAKWYSPINNLDEKDSDYQQTQIYQDHEHVDDMGVIERV